MSERMMQWSKEVPFHAGWMSELWIDHRSTIPILICCYFLDLRSDVTVFQLCRSFITVSMQICGNLLFLEPLIEVMAILQPGSRQLNEN